MRRISFALITALIMTGSKALAYSEKADALYSKFDLREKGLTFSAFEYALKGFDAIKEKYSLRADILSIADYSQSSANKRLYILDLKKEKILFHTWVAHGKYTGNEYSTDFSNIENSKKTSLGFYMTAETYNGSNGYSLRLDGLDKSYNDNARKRYIVMHGAWYVSQEQINKYGRIGRSWGCPAVEKSIHNKLLNTVKEGTVLFHYTDDKKYLDSSIWLN